MSSLDLKTLTGRRRRLRGGDERDVVVESTARSRAGRQADDVEEEGRQAKLERGECRSR